MRIFFLIFLLAYVGGNVYIFIRTLQMLSGFSLAMKILLSVIYWLVAFSLVIAMLTRHIDMPVILSKSMFHIGSVWLVFSLYMIFALLLALNSSLLMLLDILSASRCDEDICAVTKSRFLLCAGSDLLSASVRLL